MKVNMKKVNLFRSKLLILVSNELNKNIKKTIMKINSKDLKDINDDFSINYFQVFMENPIEIGQPSNFGNRKDFENNTSKRKNIHKKIPSFLNFLSISPRKKEIKKKKKMKELIFVKKKISQLKQSLGPRTNRIKKKKIEYSKKYLIKKSIKYLRKLSESLKDLYASDDKLNKNRDYNSNRIIQEQSIHDVLRRNILNEVFLFDTPNYSPMIHYK